MCHIVYLVREYACRCYGLKQAMQDTCDNAACRTSYNHHRHHGCDAVGCTVKKKKSLEVIVTSADPGICSKCAAARTAEALRAAQKKGGGVVDANENGGDEQ
ncbi:hypothetical protein AURDEDRAFT_172658 [Auricularia subglabra TFB-10046 SS5]|nr:hypothetical protein AURDEDRAFT_172658 [Auricularia subglabra TFB-10046 SS5]